MTLDETRLPFWTVALSCRKAHRPSAEPWVILGCWLCPVEDFIGGLRELGLGDLLWRTQNDIAHTRS